MSAGTARPAPDGALETMASVGGGVSPGATGAWGCLGRWVGSTPPETNVGSTTMVPS